MQYTPAPSVSASAATSPLQGRSGDSPVKTDFAPGDIIALSYYHGKKPIITDVTSEALDPGSPTVLTWLTAAPLIVNADTARIVATYAANDEPVTNNGITTYPDKLQAVATAGDGINYTTDPATITLTFRHTQTLLVIGTVESTETGSLTLKDGEPVDIVITDDQGADKTIRTGEAPDPGSPAELAVIAPPGATINSVSFTLSNGMNFTAHPVGAGLVSALESGTRHPINITVSGQTATITPPAEGEITPWGTEETAYPVPEGYDRAIYTEAHLVAFRDATHSTDQATRVILRGKGDTDGRYHPDRGMDAADSQR